MNVLKNILLHSMVSIALLSCEMANGQAKDAAFDLMLKGIYKNTVPQIKQEPLHNKTGYVLLDTREKQEFLVSHIGGAIWVGYESFKISSVAGFPKDTMVVVYCAVGYRSERIGEQLLENGFTNVHNLYGGIFDWINHGNEVVNKQGAKTDTVHAFSKVMGVWLNQGIKVY